MVYSVCNCGVLDGQRLVPLGRSAREEKRDQSAEVGVEDPRRSWSHHVADRLVDLEPRMNIGMGAPQSGSDGFGRVRDR
jgi:hypothetical protein